MNFRCFAHDGPEFKTILMIVDACDGLECECTLRLEREIGSHLTRHLGQLFGRLTEHDTQVRIVRAKGCDIVILS